MKDMKSIQGSILVRQKIYWFDHEDNDEKYEIIIELPDSCLVKDCIQHAIKLFSKKLELTNPRREVSSYTEDYALFTAKKSGQAYFDFPSFALE